MKEEKTVKMEYVGDQHNTFLKAKHKTYYNISPGKIIEVPSDVAKQLEEQGNYKRVDKTVDKTKKEEK